MAVPWNAIQVVLISAVYAALVEGVMWVLFYRNSSYSRQMDQLEKIGKKLEVAQQESAADPVREPTRRMRAAAAAAPRFGALHCQQHAPRRVPPRRGGAATAAGPPGCAPRAQHTRCTLRAARLLPS